MSADLITQLRAALDAEEATASAATPGPWIAHAYTDYDCDFEATIGTGHDTHDTANVVGHGYEGGGVQSMTDARHIAAHDPAFVLADITAKRALIDLHRPIRQRSTGSGGGTIDDCAICDAYPAQYPCATLRLLAEAYGIRP